MQDHGVPEAPQPMNGPISRAQILDASDLKRDTVDVPEWGGTVLIQEMTAADREAIDAELVEIRMSGRKTEQRIRDSALATYKVKVVAASILDPDTEQRMFAEKDLVQLGRKSSAAINRVYDAARKLSGIDEGDVEELTGNSESDPSEPSSSD